MDRLVRSSEHEYRRILRALTALLSLLVIDDYLPVEVDGNLSCAATAKGDHFWPSLLEKAVSRLPGLPI